MVRGETELDYRIRNENAALSCFGSSNLAMTVNLGELFLEPSSYLLTVKGVSEYAS